MNHGDCPYCGEPLRRPDFCTACGNDLDGDPEDGAYSASLDIPDHLLEDADADTYRAAGIPRQNEGTRNKYMSPFCRPAWTAGRWAMAVVAALLVLAMLLWVLRR